MHTVIDPKPGSTPFRISLGLGFGLFLAVALALLWGEHRVHILGALPYGLLLLCVVLHRFMHGGHIHRGDGADEPGGTGGHS